jgi:DNA-directed RNA polymerase subunit RPC12/RpoP
MNPIVSSDTFDAFFAWAPWVVGITIYLVFYFAKRREIATSMAAAQATLAQPHAAQTFACSQCGRSGSREQMVAQDHGGAVGYKCTNCAQEAELPTVLARNP